MKREAEREVHTSQVKQVILAKKKSKKKKQKII